MRRIASAGQTGRILRASLALVMGASLAHFTDLGRAPALASVEPGSEPAPARARAQRSASREPEPGRGLRPAEIATETAAATALASTLSPEPIPASTPPELRLPDSDPGGAAYRHGLVMTGATRHRLILFTFDDGPEIRHTPRLLDMLDEHGIRAVFFLTASRLAGSGSRQHQQAEVAREIVRRGHIVGNHTYSHEQLPLLEQDQARFEIEHGARIIERTVGVHPYLFRPPGGARSRRIDALIESHGYTQVLWNLGTGDYQVRTASEVVRTFRRMLHRRENSDGQRGGIVLMHDTHEWTVDGFPQIIAELERRNCALLRQGAELYDIVDDPAFFYAPRGEAEFGTEAPSAIVLESILARRQERLREQARQRCEARASL
ncbi:MAG: polysaccharide deacetylase family protein [Myxococcales bacterium]|nr:polysaccharide deacetylase family protein [Myxococcales bacterium]